MKDEHLEQILTQAQACAMEASYRSQPWPVAVFSAVGAWLVTLPALALVIWLVLEAAGGTGRNASFFVCGAVLLVAGLSLSYALPDSLFFEQASNCVCLCGLGLIGGITLVEFPYKAQAVIAGVTLLLAFTTRPDWLRAPLGGVAALLVQFAWGSAFEPHYGMVGAINFHGLGVSAAIWLSVLLVRQSPLCAGLVSQAGLRLEAIADGWIVATCACFAAWVGSTFLLSSQWAWDGHEKISVLQWQGILSGVLVLMAGGWFMLQWKSLRDWRWCGAVVAFADLACFSPALGPVTLCLTACVLSGRTRIAMFQGICALWILGAAYYQSTWPLIMKAQVFASVGVVFLLCAYARGPGLHPLPILSRTATPASAAATDRRQLRYFAGTCAVLVLLTANATLIQREYQIAQGTRIFVELGPRDPRSLMQGDYMVLRTSLDFQLSDAAFATRELRAILKIDADGIVRSAMPWDNRKLEKDERTIGFEIKNGMPVFATDAWYFTEGDAERWSRARYGEYRVTPGGRVYLVGLRGDGLSSL
jgi:uncharacterized membrane-anchored protein